ncbi:glycoside hydrolase family 16 protein [Algoriphagus halophytocola]|uniref:Glycoside hydrolase family 16 protein n=1 Tax=Algoriphagus halophytocola TaxID=2991499 RepID=A0ABY6MIK7_9BACT|nr:MULTISPECIES: glycoside hydrolase family 16 protein [unclassified Algoriphagus]UZD22252.1 glycoside hydrolase family 16 protein [Algoriphagus sp. TR-M5]WBL43500.1 glycoside hydrolase family 16 protein [Algoriphagus sp. TR-M9]
MKQLLFLFSFIICINSCIQAQEARLLWSDEFNTEGLPDPNHWNYDVGDHGWGNEELEYYTQNDLKNARIERGILIIEARADSTRPKGYTSARLVTKGNASWKYGYVEVKAKLPEGRGTWPAIWMLPDENTYGGWPKSGEIDIMEHVGYDPGKVHGTVHTEAFNHTIGTQKGGSLLIPDFHTDFHVFAIDWTAEKIDFFINGKKYFTFENTGGDYKEWPFDQTFHLILNIAVGGGWGGQQGVATDIWPQRMEVDYVRVYDQNPQR